MSIIDRNRRQIEASRLRRDDESELPNPSFAGRIIDGKLNVETVGDGRSKATSITNGAIEVGDRVIVKGGMADAMPRVPEKIPTQPKAPILKLKVLILRYSWTASDGVDLDTRTAILGTWKESRPIVDIGWNRQQSLDDLVQWQGDNTSAGGYESVIFHLDRLEPLIANTLSIRLRAFWYNEVRSGNVQISATTYSSGEITSDRTAFGSEQVSGKVAQSLSFSRSVTLQQSANIDGADLGTLTLNYKSGRLSID